MKETVQRKSKNMKAHFKKAYFKKATLTSGHFNILFVPIIAYGKYDSERWKYRHVIIFGWLCWTYAICIE